MDMPLESRALCSFAVGERKQIIPGRNPLPVPYARARTGIYAGNWGMGGSGLFPGPAGGRIAPASVYPTWRMGRGGPTKDTESQVGTAIKTLPQISIKKK